MYLGIDLGTSGVKAILLDETGAVAAAATAPLSVQRPQPLWSEQNPQDWWTATEVAVLSLPANLRALVQSVGLAGQMHGAVLLDAQDQPLRPAILWNDGRSYAECAELEATVPDARSISGNIAMPGFTAPKLLWVKKHEPEIFARLKTVLLPKDYLRLLMSGDKATDMSDSAGTLWLNVARRDWSDELLAATGLLRAHMPTLYEGTHVTGKLLADVAARWGMNVVPIAAGAGDNAAGAAGIGVIAEGDGLLSLGTSGVIFTATHGLRANPAGAVHAFCHCLPDTWHQMSVHLSAASCVDWAATQLGMDGPAAFIAAAESLPAGTCAEIFLPYLSGERTPHNDPHIRASWLNMSHETSPASLAASVLEGVAFAHADGVSVLREAGTVISRLGVVGGGSRSIYWGQILASALDVELDYLDGGEVGPALGAARLARLAVTGEAVSSVCTRPAVLQTIAPDADLQTLLKPKYERYQASYQALKGI